MQKVACTALEHSSEVLRVVADAKDRDSAAMAIADLLGVDPRLADQIMDMPLSRFPGQG